jgi:hypothetical protein
VPTAVGLTTLLIIDNSALKITDHDIRDLIVRDSTLQIAILFGIAYSANGGNSAQALLAVYLYFTTASYIKERSSSKEDARPEEDEPADVPSSTMKANIDEDLESLKRTDGFTAPLPAHSEAGACGANLD